MGRDSGANLISDHEVLAEMSVLGCLFESSEGSVYDSLTGEMFGSPELRTLFESCRELYHAKGHTDIVSLISKHGDDIKPLIMSCVDAAASPARLNDYANIVRDNWRIRDLQEKITDILMGLGPGTTVKDTLTQLELILDYQRKIEASLTEQSAKPLVDCLAEWLRDLDAPTNAIKTGYGLLDYLTGGLQRKGLYVISARTGAGKTDFALNLAIKMSKHARVSYNTLEMPRTQCVERIVSNATRIDSSVFRDKKITPEEYTEIARITDALSKSNLIIDEQQQITAAEVKSKILKHRPDIIFLDNLQIMGSTKQRKNQHEEIADTTGMLKSIALKHNIVIALLVQESREADKGNSPKLGNLKGSSQIESDADGVFFLRPEHSDNILRGNQCLETKLHVAKNRHGATGVCSFYWQPQYHRYTESEKTREE